MTKLWLDDTRDPRQSLPQKKPDQVWDDAAFAQWKWAKTQSEAEAILERGDVDEAWFDHDLGLDDAGTGMGVLNWLEAKTATDPTFTPPAEMHVQSANSAMWDQMELIIQRIRDWVERREQDGGNR